MARETVIPSVSVEVVKEVVPPSPAATGIVAILGTTEKGPLLKPTRIGRYPEFIEEFGVGSAYSMPEAKQALQNGAKELVIVRLENGVRASIDLDSQTGSNAVNLAARTEGIWGNEIKAKVSDGKIPGTHKVDLYYQSEEPDESFDNLSMGPTDKRYIVKIINSESELATALDLTGTLPKIMTQKRDLTNGTKGESSKLELKTTTSEKTVLTIYMKEYSLEEDEIRVSVEGTDAGLWKITINNITKETTESYNDLALDANAQTIVNALNGSGFIEAAADSAYSFDSADKLVTFTNTPLTGWIERIPATYIMKDNENNDLIEVIGKDRGSGESGDDIAVRVMDGDRDDVVNLKVFIDGNEVKVHENLTKDPGSDYYIIKKVNDDSTLIELRYLPGTEILAEMAAAQNFSNGSNPDKEDFETGLTQLEKEADVDIVVPSIQYPPPNKFTDTEFKYSQDIFAAVDSHCKNMSDAACNRIGYGSVSRMESLEDSKKRTETFASDRFVITAPHGIVGAVAGLVGRMTYFYSPTFKAITGLTTLERDFSPTDLRTLLGAYIVPLDAKKGRGLIIIRGLTTDGDQISVRRVADYAVRNVKNIAERFIGNLNTQDGRDALKQKIFEFLQQMEKDTAIVPSTDGTDPAFKVDVYSTQRDFALGIVRLDIAVRPVRAMDYIYATILVQV